MNRVSIQIVPFFQPYNRYERVVSVFSRAGFPTEHLRADFISEKVSGLDVSRTLQPRFGAAAAAAAADVTALLNDSDFDENNREEEEEEEEEPSGISPAALRDLETDWSAAAAAAAEEEAMDDHVANELFDDFSPPPKGTTQPASLKAEKILSAIATSFPKKNEIGQIQTPDSGYSPQQPKKLGQRQMPVPKTPAAPRLMPLPNARLTPQPRSAAAAAAMMPPSPLESVMKKANLKQTTLNWTPSRKRILDQPAASPAARAETPSTAAAPTAASQSAQPPRLKSILKQTKLHWPQAPGRHLKRKKAVLSFLFYSVSCVPEENFFYWC